MNGIEARPIRERQTVNPETRMVSPPPSSVVKDNPETRMVSGGDPCLPPPPPTPHPAA